MWRQMQAVFQRALHRQARRGRARRRGGGLWRQSPVLKGRSTRVAAIVVIVAALGGLALHLTVGIVAGMGSLVAWLTPDAGRRVAWTDVLEHVRQAHTLRYTMTVRTTGRPTEVWAVGALEPGRRRLTGPETVQIIDRVRGKVLTWDIVAKQAWPGAVADLPVARRLDVVAGLKSLDPAGGRYDGRWQVESRDTAAFKVRSGGRNWTIWADSRTARPVRVAIESASGDTTWDLTDLETGVELDEAEFIFAPPADFKMLPRAPLTDSPATAPAK